jgi:hypothetical protein
LQAAKGDAYISVMADLETPPELIIEFVRYWKEGYSVVFGEKTQSNKGKLDKAFRRFYYWATGSLSDFPLLGQVTGFGLFDRTAIDAILRLKDPESSSRHVIPELGFRTKLVSYSQPRRRHGRSGFGLYQSIAFGIESICRTSRKPIRLMTLIGFLTALICFLIGGIYLILKLLNWDSFSIGFAPILIGVFFIGAIQLFSIGIIGEYVAIVAVRQRSEKRAAVIEDDRINFEP